MIYITAKRFKRSGIDGNFNIPYNTLIEEQDGYLWYKNKRICVNTSAVMRDYFVRNDDGMGLKRYELSHQIIDNMLRKDDETIDSWNTRWEPLWVDATANKYRKDFSETTFLWGVSLFNAPILDLYHILALTERGEIKE